MEGIINEEVKEYIIDCACNLVSKNRDFNKIFGKNFVRERLKENLENVITNVPEKEIGLGGYYKFNKDIVIFYSGKNGSKLTVKDVKRKKLTEILLHEIMHAVLRKTYEECKNLEAEIYKYTNECNLIKMSTGVCILFENREIGRGLNEGLTTWFCDILGKHNEKIYENLTNIVHQLEHAVGKRNLMKIAKGRSR